MLLRLATPAADWARIAALLAASGSPDLAATVRAALAAAPRPGASEPVALNFTPAQTAHLQRAAARLGVHLPARPATEEPSADGWLAPEAERAAAVAAAEAIVRAHQRRFTT
jgi:hypothetical protein